MKRQHLLRLLKDAVLNRTLIPTLRVLAIPRKDVTLIRQHRYQEYGGRLRKGDMPYWKMKRQLDDMLRTPYYFFSNQELNTLGLGYCYLCMYDFITKGEINTQSYPLPENLFS